MHVGVFPCASAIILVCAIIPHARGGVSAQEQRRQDQVNYSPCTWGCFSGDIALYLNAVLFPMHVGVFPTQELLGVSGHIIPHARGGVSNCS